MKLSLHKNLDGFLDYIAIMPENQQDKVQLAKISKATNSKISVHDSSIPDLQYSVVIEIKLVPKY